MFSLTKALRSARVEEFRERTAELHSLTEGLLQTDSVAYDPGRPRPLKLVVDASIVGPVPPRPAVARLRTTRHRDKYARRTDGD